MQIKTKAQLLTAESAPYDFNGNKGTSHKLRFLVDGEIFLMKKDNKAQTILDNLDKQGKTGNLTFELISPKEVMYARFISFEA